jgi:hypothetical protein
VAWLLPLAWLVASNRLPPGAGITLAYAPLVVAALWFKAGHKLD